MLQRMRSCPPCSFRLIRIWAALLVIAAVLLSSWSVRAEEAALPPAPRTWLTDAAGMLSAPTRSHLDGVLQAYERQTGRQVVVWIGDSIGSTPIEDFSVRLFQAWKPGRKGQDDGALLIVLAKDRKLAIEVGYGLEDRLTDAASSRIINEVMVPHLRAGNADEALRAGVQAILSTIEGKPFDVKQDPAHSNRSERGPPSKLSLIVFGLLGLGFLFLLITNPALALQLLVVLAASSRGGGGGGGFGGGFSGGGGRSGGGGARGSW